MTDRAADGIGRIVVYPEHNDKSTATLSQLDRPSLPSMSTNMNLFLATSLDCENASSPARICLARALTGEAEAEGAQGEQRRIWRRRRERGDEKLLVFMLSTSHQGL